MKKKSKFLTFILSFIPGLGQIYLGFTERGAVFFSALIMLIFASECFGFRFHNLEILFPIIWFAAIVDSMILADKVNKMAEIKAEEGCDKNIDIQKEELGIQNKKILSMFLSIIPGAGHLYLGLQRQGLELMAAFFALIYLSSWLNIEIFAVVIPVLWFYSIFDVLHKMSGDKDMTDDDIFIMRWLDENGTLAKNGYKIFGYALIILGCLILFDKIALPLMGSYIDERVKSFIQTGVVAVLFIFGGIKLITSNNIYRKK